MDQHQLKTVIDRAERTLRMCDNNHRFDMGMFFHPCGTASCIMGNATLACPEVLRQSGPEPNSNPTLVNNGQDMSSTDAGAVVFFLPYQWAHKLFLMYYPQDLGDDEGQDAIDRGALRIWRGMINYRRRQLATLQSEQETHAGRNGAYTTNRRAKAIPVGQEREEMLAIASAT